MDASRSIAELKDAFLLGIAPITMKGDKGVFLKYQVSVNGKVMSFSLFDPSPAALQEANTWQPAVTKGTLRFSLVPSGPFQTATGQYEGFVPDKS